MMGGGNLIIGPAFLAPSGSERILACCFVFKTEATMLIKFEFKSVIGKRCLGLWFVLSSQW